MVGKLENKIRTENNIKNILSDLPNSVSDYYYNLSVYSEPKTCEDYIKKIRRFLSFCNISTDEEIFKMKELDVIRYLKEIETKEHNGSVKPTSISYRKCVWTALNGFFTFLYQSDKMDSNPMKNIKRPKYNDNVKQVYLSKADMNSILQVTELEGGTWKERDTAIVFLLMNTGMRRTALTEINISDIDFKEKTITVLDKRHKYHTYYMSQHMEKIIREWLVKRSKITRKEEDALFITSNGSRITDKTIYNMVKKYTRMALGVSYGPHKLRAGFCTTLYNETHDIEFVKNAVGHQSTTTTSKYIMDSRNIKKEASSIMDNIFKF